MSDLISRQAAIDALCRGEGCGNICRRALEDLPSAQPEIVRCGECVFRNEINCPQYYRRTELTDDYYCADGERKDGEVE